jgi:uncharacterized membrane protein
LGVISFFAFNWQYMTKWLKLLVVFSSFICAHVAALWYGRIPKHKAIAEFLHLLGTFLFGAGIILIAQIYHIEEHAPNGVFLWSLGALLMAYVLQSTPQMLLYGILTMVWQGMELSFRTQQYWVILLTATAMGFLEQLLLIRVTSSGAIMCSCSMRSPPFRYQWCRNPNVMKQENVIAGYIFHSKRIRQASCNL